MDKFDKCEHSRSKPSGEFWDEFCWLFDKSKELVDCKNCPHFTLNKTVAKKELSDIKKDLRNIQHKLETNPDFKTDLPHAKEIMDSIQTAIDMLKAHIENDKDGDNT